MTTSTSTDTTSSSTTSSGTSTTPKRNNLGPLTTTWTQPASCTVVMQDAWDSLSGPAWLHRQCATRGLLVDDTSCYPPKTTTKSQEYYMGTPVSTWGLYSPGIICPVGYQTACSYDGSASTGDFQFYYTPESSETAVGCCPSGYFCQDEHTCVLTITSSTLRLSTCVASSLSGGSVGVVGSSYLTIPYSTTTSGYTERISSYSVLAPMIQLLYQSTDVSTTASTGSASASSQAATSSAQVQSQGLSTGAKAGIGVGVALAAIIAATIGVSLWWVRRRRGRKSVSDDQPANDEGPPISELAEGKPKEGPAELQALNRPAELHAPESPREWAGTLSQEPVELE